MSPTEQLDQPRCEPSPRRRASTRFHPPKELASNDPEVLRAALMRESIERRRAECSAGMQTEVVKLALDLLVREPDIEGFFGGLAKTMVEESESNTCAVWLLDETNQQCELWLAYVKDRLFTPPKGAVPTCADDGSGKVAFPCESMAAHLFAYAPGWTQTVEYAARRCAAAASRFASSRAEMDWQSTVATPLRLGDAHAGLDDGVQRSALGAGEPVVARRADRSDRAPGGAGAASQPPGRAQSRRRTAQGDPRGAQPPGARHSRQPGAGVRRHPDAAAGRAARSGARCRRRSRRASTTAVDLARTHLTEARRSVGALAPERRQRRRHRRPR